MSKFTRRTFIKIVGQGSAILGLGVYSRNALAQGVSDNVLTGKLETDVAVIGAGPGGLSAALRAAELGLSVCIFEKTEKTGGVRNGGMGPFGASTHIQEKYGIKNYTAEDAFNYLLDYNHWRIDARLASEYINNTAYTIKWLEDQGIKYRPLEDKEGAEFNCFTHNFAGHPDYKDGFYACTLLTDRAKANKNIRIFMETPVKKLIKSGEAVTGLIVADKDEKELKVAAKAVVIMTGGFMGNPEMVKKYTSYTYKKDLFYTFEMPNLTGDGINMAWEAGAVSSEMMMAVYKGMPIYGGPHGTKTEWGILGNPNLMVNIHGGRFINEALSDRYYVANAIHHQPEGCAFLMLDSTIADIYRNQKSETGREGMPGGASGGGGAPGSESGSAGAPGGGGGGFASPINDIDEIVAEAKKLNYPYVFAAGSLEDLCRQTGIDLNGLKTTIAEYNSCCKAGKDPVFYKDASNLLPLKGPKYYAAKFCCDSYGAMGGIKINHKTEVLNKAFKPIPGLYAGGTDANTMYADTYCHHLSGNFTGFAYTTGLIAARNAAEYIRAKS